MKKIWIVLLASVLAFAFVSCPTGTGGGDPSYPPPLTQQERDQLYEDFRNERAEGKYHGDTITEGMSLAIPGIGTPMQPTEKTFIGYSIDLFKGPTFADAMGVPLLKWVIYSDTSNSGGNKYIDSEVFNQTENEAVVSEKLSEVFSSFKIDAEVGTGHEIPFFSGSVESSYGTSKEVKHESKFYKYTYAKLSNKHSLSSLWYATAEDKAELFDPKVFKFVDDAGTSPQALFETLRGTHIIVASGMGGSAVITALYNTDETSTEDDIKVALSFESAWVDGKVSTDITDKQKQVRKDSTIKVNTNGGTESVVGTEPESLAPQLKKWADSINNAPTIGYVYTLLPVWELAKDPARKAAIKQAFIDNADKVNADLLKKFPKGAVPEIPAVVDGATYYILNLKSQKAIDVYHQSKDSGVNVHLWDKLDIPSQKWVAIESWVNKGYFYFKNVNSGLVLDRGGSIDPRFRLIQYVMNGTDAQWWSVDDSFSTDGSVVIHPKGADSSDHISPDDVDHENGTRLIINSDYSYNGRWKLVRVDN